MESEKVKELLLKFARGIGRFARPANRALFRLTMEHFGRSLIPLISLQDGGKARGRFVGLLRQMNVDIPDRTARDRTLLGSDDGKFQTKAYMEGIREGFRVKRTRVSAELEIIITKEAHQKMRPRIREVKELTGKVYELIKKYMEGDNAND